MCACVCVNQTFHQEALPMPRNLDMRTLSIRKVGGAYARMRIIDTPQPRSSRSMRDSVHGRISPLSSPLGPSSPVGAGTDRGAADR